MNFNPRNNFSILGYGEAEYGQEVIIAYRQVWLTICQSECHCSGVWWSQIWTRGHDDLQPFLTYHLLVWVSLFWGVVRGEYGHKSWCLTTKSDLPSVNLDFIVLRCGEAEFGHKVMTLYNKVCLTIYQTACHCSDKIKTRGHDILQPNLSHHLSVWIPLFWGVVGQNKEKGHHSLQPSWYAICLPGCHFSGAQRTK